MIDPAWTVPVAGGRVRVRCSERADGDFHLGHVDPVVLEARRRALVDLPWTMLDEVHGVDVVAVASPGAADRSVGDVAWTDAADAVLGVWVGDCAPIVLVAPSGRLAVVHAGWRGLALGVLEVAVRAMTGRDRGRAADVVARAGDADGVDGADGPGGAGGVVAWLGPRIGPCCYEFGLEDLATVAGGTGLPVEALRGTTRWGSTALDVPAAVVGGLARLGVATVDSGWCTGCDPRFHSHRIDTDPARHVVAAWKEARIS